MPFYNFWHIQQPMPEFKGSNLKTSEFFKEISDYAFLS